MQGRLLLLKKQTKKVMESDWFPGPDMSVNVGRSWCIELRWLPTVGQQGYGPHPCLPALASLC